MALLAVGGALPFAPRVSAQAVFVTSSCAAAVVIDGGNLPASATVDTRSMPLDPSVPTFPCYGKLVLPTGGQVQPSRVVWFSFTPTATDTYRIDTLGSAPADYDTILGAYTGTCGSLTPVSGLCGRNGFYADDAPGSLQSSITLDLTAGTTYTFAVGAIGAANSYTGHVDPSAGGMLKINVTRVAVPYAYAYIVPALVRSGGVTSELHVTNLENADGQFLVQYLTHGNDGEQTLPARQPFAPAQLVAGGGSRLYLDVVGLFGYADDWGALYIQSTRRLLVGAHTWAPAAGGGTVGSYTVGVDVSPGATAPEALATGETGRFAGVRESATARTDLVFANTATVPCSLQAEVRDGSGALLGAARTLVVPPGTAMQKTRLRDTFAIAGDVRNASVVVRAATPGCSVVGVAYVSDGNTTPGTNDRYAVPLRK